ncbi:MAG: hypothetical protein ACPG47_02580 [Leucothrix sp.]
MTDIPATTLFHTLDQLKGALFPLETVPPEEALVKEGDVDEAEILANKLIEDLLKPPGNHE